MNSNQITRQWHQIDASKDAFGRIASKIANILRGKIKRNFLPNVDMGDYVVVVNCDKLKFTGKKIKQKKYYRHSGYLGGLKTTTLEELYNRKPQEVVKKAVYSMLDEVKFRKKMISRLKLLKGSEHNFKIDKIW